MPSNLAAAPISQELEANGCRPREQRDCGYPDSQQQPRRPVAHGDGVRSGVKNWDDSLRHISTQDRHDSPIDPRGPAWHPGISDDEQAGSLSGHTENRAIGVERGPLRRREGLARAGRCRGQRVVIHHDRLAGIESAEEREDERGRLVRDCRGGHDVGTGKRGGIAQSRSTIRPSIPWR